MTRPLSALRSAVVIFPPSASAQTRIVTAPPLSAAGSTDRRGPS